MLLPIPRLSVLAPIRPCSYPHPSFYPYSYPFHRLSVLAPSWLLSVLLSLLVSPNRTYVLHFLLLFLHTSFSLCSYPHPSFCPCCYPFLSLSVLAATHSSVFLSLLLSIPPSLCHCFFLHTSFSPCSYPHPSFCSWTYPNIRPSVFAPTHSSVFLSLSHNSISHTVPVPILLSFFLFLSDP